MGKWVKENTKGTIVPEIRVEAQQLMHLMNTVYFTMNGSTGLISRPQRKALSSGGRHHRGDRFYERYIRLP